MKPARCVACRELHGVFATIVIYACAACPDEHYLCGRCRRRLDMPLDLPCPRSPDFEPVRLAMDLMGGGA